MITVAVVLDGEVVNVVVFSDDDRDIIPTFDFSSSGVGAYGVIVSEGQPIDIGYSYKDGEFTAPPPPEPTHEQLVIQAENEKQNRLSSADAVFLEWQTKLLLNIASDDEKQAVINWVNYKDAVRSVDTQQAPNIDWPEVPAIPAQAQ